MPWVPSCAEKLHSEELVSKSLFGPPLESAFDQEDFTGDRGGVLVWGRGLQVGGVTKEKMRVLEVQWAWPVGAGWAASGVASPDSVSPRLQQPGLHLQPLAFFFLLT